MNTKSKKILSIIILSVMGILFTLVGSKNLIHSRQLEVRGKDVTGQVLDGEDDVSGRFHRHTYYLQVRFQPENGGPVNQRVEVSGSVYQSVSIGSTVKVHYLLEDPAICQAGDTVELRYGNLLWGIVFILGAGYLLVFFRQPADKQEAVESIGEHVKTLSITQFEYVSVKAEDFKHLDLAFYDQGRRHLEALGYRFLDDQENVTLRRRSGIHTFLRILLSGDQTTMADLYHFVPKFTLRLLGAKPAKVLDLETWFSDGHFVCTSNAEMAGKLDSPPAIDALRLPAATTWDMLVEAHQRRVSNYLANHREAKPVKLSGLADVRRAQDEQQRIKAEFRRRTGLSRTELERFAGTQGKAVDELHDALTERRERGQ
jgi:hypothetical protein